MSLSTLDWHKRFEQQARWTQDLRRYLYPRVGLSEAECILDVGCGTGALLGELKSLSDALVFGMDIQRESLELAQTNQGVLLSQGDAHHLPYPKNSFDITQCHFTLMWVSDPKEVLDEMVRVSNTGGVVIALAEPDYGGRVDYPIELEQIGEWQIESLKTQGADPFMGRKLSALFSGAGLINVETGVLGAQWTGTQSKDEVDLEWAVLESDIEKTFRDLESLKIFKEIDKTSRERGERVLYVPTFYAIGWKP